MSRVNLCILWYRKPTRFALIFCYFLILFFCWPLGKPTLADFPLFQGTKNPSILLMLSSSVGGSALGALVPGSARSSDFSLGRIRSCFVQTALLWEVCVNAASRAAPSCQVLCQRSLLQCRCGFAGFLSSS